MKCSLNKSLTIAAVSDIHLGHPNNKAEDIVAGLDAAFPDDEETDKLDLIVLVGDVFDRLLNVPNEDIYHIDRWIARLLLLCAKRNIKLRVLEGTPSHDWKQSSSFERIKSVLQCELDFKYVSTLSIERIDSLGIDVLYVPDEWEITTDKTLEQVKELLASKGLEKVDYAFMHGQFEYQLPAHIKKLPRHDSSEYLKLVKDFIFIGHIHIHSVFDRIIAQGSFDRLSHGEEGPKGHVRSIVNKIAREYFFIENKLAKIYKTLKCTGLSMEQTLSLIREEGLKLTDKARVRITAESTHPIFSNFNELVAMYPTLVWSKDPKKKEEPDVEQEESFEHEAIIINKTNIAELVMSRVRKENTNTELLEEANKLLSAAL